MVFRFSPGFPLVFPWFLAQDLLKNHGERKIQDVTVEMAINGARAIKSMVTETSDLDANMGPLAETWHAAGAGGSFLVTGT